MKKNIKIDSITDVTTLVAKASAVDGDVTLSKGRYAVDAKSLMGVMSIDISRGAEIEYPENAKDFDEFVSNFVI